MADVGRGILISFWTRVFESDPESPTRNRFSEGVPSALLRVPLCDREREHERKIDRRVPDSSFIKH